MVESRKLQVTLLLFKYASISSKLIPTALLPSFSMKFEIVKTSVVELAFDLVALQSSTTF